MIFSSRFWNGCAAASCEYLAVTQTVQEDQTWNSSCGCYNNQATGVRYYALIAPAGTQTVPAVLSAGDFYDTSGNLYYRMPSDAIDKDQSIVYTFNVGDGSSNTCFGANPCYPSVYADSIDDNGTPGTQELVQQGAGSITDTSSNGTWGYQASVAIDPGDDSTFHGTSEYLDSEETVCHMGSNTNCTWDSAIFTCTKGSSGLCP